MIADDPDQIDRLLERLRVGDAQALGELFALYQGPLRRMIDFRLDHRLNGRLSPSDILQDVYLDAMKRVDHYLEKPEMSFFAWLRLVAGQCLADAHRRHLGARRRDARQEISLDHGETANRTSVCLARHLVASHSSPSQAVMRGESLAQVERIVNAMDPIDREVLALRHFEELSNKQVAEILGIDTPAASKRYVRALVRLKEELSRIPGLIDFL